MILRLPGIATSKTPAIAASNSATPTGSTPSRAKKEICTGFPFCRMKTNRSRRTSAERIRPAHRPCAGVLDRRRS
jgi:hypothetical protein